MFSLRQVISYSVNSCCITDAVRHSQQVFFTFSGGKKRSPFYVDSVDNASS